MAVVSNSSPLILFARIGRLELLRQLFGEVLVPPAVRDETIGTGDRLGAVDLANAVWITVRSLPDPEQAHALQREVDLGEAEAIALAEQLGAGVRILLDDRRGRLVALQRRLDVLGSAGVLVLAKRRGIVPSVRPILDELRAAGLYLSESAYDELLAAAGELPA